MIFLYTNLYRLVIAVLVQIAKIFPESKTNAFILGRAQLLQRWQKAAANVKKKRIWFHVSSVGELEQVRPILQAWREQGKDLCFFLSYYSPEVPRLVKDWSFVDYADFLPLDFPEENKKFLEILAPDLLVLNRYDLWPNLFQAAKAQNLSIALVNASTPPLGWIGKISMSLRRSMFQQIKIWTYVDATAASAWEPYIHPSARALVTGNPRVDRVLTRIAAKNKFLELEALLQRTWKYEKKQTIIAGSVWPQDEDLLLKTFAFVKEKNREAKLILVPHEPSQDQIIHLQKNSSYSVEVFSQLSTLSSVSQADILLVDQRGFLAELYGVGAVAYVGGGFAKEVHSIIEPVAHGLRVAFGPHYQRSPEAENLLAMGAAFICAQPNTYYAEKLAQWFALGFNEESRKLKQKLGMYLSHHRGAGARTAKYLDNEWKKSYAGSKSV